MPFWATRTEEVKAALRAQLGLDKPIYVQYFSYIGKLLQFDFGKSITSSGKA